MNATAPREESQMPDTQPRSANLAELQRRLEPLIAPVVGVSIPLSAIAEDLEAVTSQLDEAGAGRGRVVDIEIDEQSGLLHVHHIGRQWSHTQDALTYGFLDGLKTTEQLLRDSASEKLPKPDNMPEETAAAVDKVLSGYAIGLAEVLAEMRARAIAAKNRAKQAQEPAEAEESKQEATAGA